MSIIAGLLQLATKNMSEPQLLIAKAVAWLIAVLVAVFGVLYVEHQIRQQGYEAGRLETEAKLRKEFASIQADQAKQVNEKIDALLKSSQDQARAINDYVADGREYNNKVLATVRGKVLFAPNDCGAVNRTFIDAWNQLSTHKGEKK
jgi:uncharacterized protein YlxW (UPF0749 family)